VPAEADPGSTVVSGEGIELAAVGTTAQVVVKLEDKFGNPITDPGTSTVNVLFNSTERRCRLPLSTHVEIDRN
jgi:hypothetical protein